MSGGAASPIRSVRPWQFQLEGKAGALAVTGADVEIAPHRGEQGADGGKPEPGAREAKRNLLRAKRLEHRFLDLFREPTAGVVHPEPEACIRAGLTADGDGAGVRVAECVAREVEQH